MDERVTITGVTCHLATWGVSGLGNRLSACIASRDGPRSGRRQGSSFPCGQGFVYPGCSGSSPPCSQAPGRGDCLRVSPLARCFANVPKRDRARACPTGRASRVAECGAPPVNRTLNCGDRVACGSRAACHRGDLGPVGNCPANTFVAQRFQTHGAQTPRFGAAWNTAIFGRRSMNPGKWDTLGHGRWRGLDVELGRPCR